LCFLGANLFLAEHTVRVWDFTRLQPAQWEWQFPGNPASTPEGVAYTAAETGPGPRIDGLALPARALTKIRIHAQIIDPASGAVTPPELIVYWARPEDLAAPVAGNPFQFERGCFFYPESNQNPFVLVAEPPVAEASAFLTPSCVVSSRKIWEGTIQSMLIAVKVPEVSSKGYKVIVSRIEFVR
jgi:hypothetical protein